MYFHSQVAFGLNSTFALGRGGDPLMATRRSLCMDRSLSPCKQSALPCRLLNPSRLERLYEAKEAISEETFVSESLGVCFPVSDSDYLGIPSTRPICKAIRMAMTSYPMTTTSH